jgi:hypothetical protein
MAGFTYSGGIYNTSMDTVLSNGSFTDVFYADVAFVSNITWD